MQPQRRWWSWALALTLVLFGSGALFLGQMIAPIKASILLGAAALLVVIGINVLVFWRTRPEKSE